MKYRELGRTGMKVSEIGYGAEYLEGKPFELVDAVVNTALDGEVNIIDVFMPQPEVRSNIGRAIGSRRKNVILQGHIGATMKDGQYKRSRDPQECDVFIKDFLTRLNTDYIDIGMLHYIDTEEDFKSSFDTPFIEYAQKLKKDGVIRLMGVSTHSAETGIKMINTGLIDVVMFSLNPAFDWTCGISEFDIISKDGVKLDKLEIDPIRAEFYNLCAAQGVGITAMKALGAGWLLSKESSLGVAMTVPQCVSFALDRPAVSSVLLGAQTVEEMKQALAYENTTQEERNYTEIMKNGLPMLNGKCMYCNHCLPCPQGIDIAAVTKFLDIAKASDNETIRAHYNVLPTKGSDCIECGKCESNCPFNIKVIENMREAVRVFGT
jgi:predicted aldo/keto reductase-like oxidoreductase